ncbi:MAG TPA: hypothetical protein VJH23_04355 [archaeon]|nr:hypothetical protein [archaeon]
MAIVMIYLLDASALLNDELFSFDAKNKHYTTSKVFAEWRDFRSRLLAENAASTGSLIIQDPCPLSIQKTTEKCGQSGTRLSEADISIVALASEFKGRGQKFTVLTDDYSVQNILKKIGADFSGAMHGEIKKHRSFKKKKK